MLINTNIEEAFLGISNIVKDCNVEKTLGFIVGSKCTGVHVKKFTCIIMQAHANTISLREELGGMSDSFVEAYTTDDNSLYDKAKQHVESLWKIIKPVEPLLNMNHTDACFNGYNLYYSSSTYYSNSFQVVSGQMQFPEFLRLNLFTDEVQEMICNLKRFVADYSNCLEIIARVLKKVQSIKECAEKCLELWNKFKTKLKEKLKNFLCNKQI